MAPAPDPTVLNEALRRLHRSAILSLALCATGIGIAAFTGPEASAEGGDRSYSWLALTFAVTAILTRRTAPLRAGSLRWLLYGALVSMLAAVSLGVLGAVVALYESQTQVGLLYTLAGALLVLRPPATLSGNASTES